MKNIIIAFIGVLITIYTILIAFSVLSYEARKNELENLVSRVVKNTLENEYQKGDKETVAQNLVEELTLDVGSNGTVEVSVDAIDLKKGIISVTVTEHFRQFNGMERIIVCKKTAIVEQHTQELVTRAQSKELQIHTATGETALSNAYMFYQEYGDSKMVFEPGDSKEGMIYYGTRGKCAPTAKIRYENLGWQVTIQDAKGTVVEQIYYYIEGGNMKKIDARDVDSYRYSLYCVSLENLKSRLSTKACEVLVQPDSSIIFDACITVVKNNVRQGEMSDSGMSWGKVYTTYDGIVNAQNWSEKTKEALKSYYNKTVENLFYQVELNCGTGISSVSGAGEYCYGTEVTIDAIPERGYTFYSWIGTKSTTSQKYTFKIYENVSMTATTTRDEVAVNLYRNFHNKDTIVYTLYVRLQGEDYVLQNVGWKKAGFHQTGWSTSRIIAQAYFAVEQRLLSSWLESVSPSVDLYAVWSPNKYVVRYNGNGAAGYVDEVNANYTESIQLPSEGYEFEEGRLVGWSLSPDSKEPEFLCGQTVEVSELVDRLGLEHTPSGVITFYAIEAENPKVYIRFISDKYYKDEKGKWIAEQAGGLWEDSIWRKNSIYSDILDELF